LPPAASDDRPEWDHDDADGLVGLYVLVGITHLKGDAVVSQSQYHGRIISADPKAGFKIDCEGKWKGYPMGLPPDLRVFQSAKPGEYRLRSAGETVQDPDLLATWTVNERAKS
jgi:hypothetical protein